MRFFHEVWLRMKEGVPQRRLRFSFRLSRQSRPDHVWKLCEVRFVSVEVASYGERGIIKSEIRVFVLLPMRKDSARNAEDVADINTGHRVLHLISTVAKLLLESGIEKAIVWQRIFTIIPLGVGPAVADQHALQVVQV